jgi:hypothetical protein
MGWLPQTHQRGALVFISRGCMELLAVMLMQIFLVIRPTLMDKHQFQEL